MRIHSLQILRYVAAALVLLYHASKHASNGFMFGAFDLGYAGVDIFFVLSGFVIAMSQNGKSRKFDFWRFILNRFFRIYPSYWVFLFFPLAILGIFISNYSPSPEAFLKWDIILTFLLVFGHPVISQVTWTLSYELFFYTIFGLLAKFNKVKYLSVYAGVILFLFITINVYKIEGVKYIFNPIILEFLGGVLAYWIVNRYKSKSKYIYAILVIGLIMFVLSLGQFWGDFNQREYRYIFFGLPSLLVIYSLAHLDKNNFLNLKKSLLTRLGDASYVMYLIHSPILSFIAVFLPSQYYQLGMMGLLVGISFLSLLLYNWIDKPIYLYLKNRVK
jgi:exopolysaccharide production protein ExoZ